MELSWYVQRARVMGRQEILHRVKERLSLALLRSRHKYSLADQNKLCESKGFRFCDEAGLLPEPTWDLALLKEDSSELLLGNWTALGYPWKWENDESWFLAPDTNKTWPKRFFSSIPYREGNPYGDLRVMWEPARLQQLVSYALIAKHGRLLKERNLASKLLRAQLLSWFHANPHLEGVHYISAMDCGLRMIAMQWTWQGTISGKTRNFGIA